MAVSSATVGPEAWEARSGPQQWDKTSQDIAEDSESFLNARDLGQIRNSHTRVSVVSALTETADKTDFFKIDVVSTGNLRITLRDSGNGSKEEKPLDLSKYQDYIEDLPGYVAPEDETESTEEETDDGPLDLSKYTKYLEQFNTEEEVELTEEGEEAIEEINKTESVVDKSTEDTIDKYQEVLDQLKAAGVRFQFYSHDGYRETLIADSVADDDSDEKKAFEQLARGEYKITEKGEYYIKITRQEDVDQDKTYQYAIQMQMGEEYEHDYLTTEVAGSDEATTYNNPIFGTSTAHVSYQSSLSALSVLSSFNAAQSNGSSYSSVGASSSSAMSGAVMAGNTANSLLVGGYNSINNLNETENKTDLFG